MRLSPWRRIVPGVVMAAVAVAASAPTTRATQPTPPATPALLVIVVVDQMRSDYLTRLTDRFSGGFRRLLDHGAVFDENYYPYLNTVTCAGHATIGTGALPKTHGAILNQWYDRAQARMRTCTDDPTVRTFTYGSTATGRGHSAAALRVPTLGDHLRRRSPASRVVTLSMKARSALMLAGTTATAATWLGDDGFVSSTAYGGPRPELAPFLLAHPMAAQKAEVWERLLPVETYTGADAGVGERPDPGWGPTFPHPLSAPPPADFHTLWEESPYSDSYLGDLAATAVREFKLGGRDAVDLLGVSFSATDLVGHSFGPDSHEVQDTLLRLDRTLGRLLAVLDREVGRDRYVLGLSADHGAAMIPEARAAGGLSAGRVPLGLVRATVDKALAGLGPGPHVARAEYTQVYLTPETRAKATAATLAPALAALKALPGIQGAVWNEALDQPVDDMAASTLAAVRGSYDRERSGDLSIVPADGWIFVLGSRLDGGDGTTHGSPNAYDQHVPLIFLGRPFPAGHYSARVSPADLAPTLAATVGLAIPDVEGRPVTFGAAMPR